MDNTNSLYAFLNEILETKLVDNSALTTLNTSKTVWEHLLEVMKDYTKQIASLSALDQRKLAWSFVVPLALSASIIYTDNGVNVNNNCIKDRTIIFKHAKQ